MREPANIRLLPDGRRLHLQDGPIDLIVEASGSSTAVHAAYEAAARRFITILDELCAELPLLRERARPNAIRPSGGVARRMADVVAPYQERWFITPMAAVAGAVAETVLESMIDAAKIDRGYVNNGGDIALHLTTLQSYTIGMVARPNHPSLFGSFEISSDLPVRGVATSGWRGRSFSLGIADAVTVLANSAAGADAAATILANSVDLPGHASIVRVPACEIAPDSDLREIPITRHVGELNPAEIEQALSSGSQLAEELLAEGLICAAAFSLQGQTRIVAPDTVQDHLGISRRSLLHA